MPDEDFFFSEIWWSVTWQGSVKSVPEPVDGPVKDGNNKDESEVYDVDNCSSWAEKLAPEQFLHSYFR